MKGLLSLLILVSVYSVQGGQVAEGNRRPCKQLGGLCVPIISRCHVIQNAKCRAGKKCCPAQTGSGRKIRKKVGNNKIVKSKNEGKNTRKLKKQKMQNKGHFDKKTEETKRGKGMKMRKNRKKGPKRKCKKTPKKCKKKGGVCIKREECTDIIDPDLCKGYSCVCCKQDIVCKEKKKCLKKGGICSMESCDITENEIPKGCKGKGCKCCAPIKDCKQTKKCVIKKGGICVRDPYECPPGWKLTKGCKKKEGCQCCVPVIPPAPTPTTPKPKTTPTPKRTTPKQTTPKRTTPKLTTPKRTTPKQTTPKSPTTPTPKSTIPKPTTPNQTTPNPTTTKTPTTKPTTTAPPTSKPTTKSPTTTTAPPTTAPPSTKLPPTTNPTTTNPQTTGPPTHPPTTTKSVPTTEKPTTSSKPTTTAEITTTPTTPTVRCGIENPDGKRIVNGVAVDVVRKYSWQVGLTSALTGFYYCGGSIITDKHILTAAHCFYNPGPPCVENIPAEVYVGIGDHNQDQTNDLSDFVNPILVNKVYINPDYNCSTYASDVAILELTTPIDLPKHSNAIHPICLPKDNSKDYEGLPALITGWGTTIGYNIPPGPPTIQEPPTAILREAQVTVKNINGCKSNYSTIPLFVDLQLNLCAGTNQGFENDGKDTCQGDSGGPLSVKESEQYVQIGIVSYGWGCASKGFPGVYARVGHFLDWIKSQVAPETIYNLP